MMDDDWLCELYTLRDGSSESCVDGIDDDCGARRKMVVMVGNGEWWK